MKPAVLSRTFRNLSVVIFFIATALLCRAQTAQDDAAKNVYTNGWFSGTNGGTGFGSWTLVSNNNPAGGDYSGFLIASSGTVDVSNKSFTMYANGVNYDSAVAYRAFNTPLTTSGVFTLKFRNNYIANGGVAGFSLRNGTDFTQTNDLITLAGNARFSFYFLGGNASYTLWDGGGPFVLPDVPYTSGGLTLQFALLPGDQYLFTIKSGDGNTVIATYTGPLNGAGGSSIDSFACYALDIDYNGVAGDVSFNQPAVVPATSLPPVIQNVTPASGAFYQPTATPVTFSASTTFSTINTNNIKLTANGVTVSNLVFTGNNTNWSVTASPVLTTNLFYTNVITVTDNNNNVSSNVFYFNTWSANDLFIEAEDYNYGGGGAILSPTLGQYDTLTSIAAKNGIDYLKLVIPDGGTNLYRVNDACELELSGDSFDHGNYFAGGVTNWSWSFIQSGEWMNYTRKLVTNTAYNVYARYSGGPQPTILMERHANPFATSTNQPVAALGTFVGPNTGNIVSNYNFTPLTDFFSSNVVVRFAQLTNTFRLTRIGDQMNLDYLIFVPVANTNTQRPYLSAGYPFPGATGILPDQQITFTIANRQTTNNPALLKLFVNNVDVSGGVLYSNNAAGTFYSYLPAQLYPMNATNTVTVIYTDSAGVAQTNGWTFATTTVLTVPPGYALNGTTGNAGFNIHLVKFPDTYPGNVSPQPLSSAWAEAMLSTNVVFTNNQTAYTAWVTNVNFAETNTINYENCGTNQPYGWWSVSGERAYPFVPGNYANCADTNGPNNQVNSPNNLALAANFYVQLNAGLYQWAVRSDDGFRLTTGTGATPTNTLIMDFEGGRGADTPSVFTFVIQTNGIYPMRLLYYQGGFGGSVEFYSVNRLTGAPLLINDASASAIRVYQSVAVSAPIVLLNPARSGGTFSYNFVAQSGKSYTNQFKTTVNGATWTTFKVVAGGGASTNITDPSASNATRFYRVTTQ